jgi:integrase
MSDSYLKQRGLTWYVNVKVPAAIQSIVGKQNIQRSLKTRDKALANRRKHETIADIHKYFDVVRKANAEGTTELDRLTSAAKTMSKEIKLGIADPEYQADQWSLILDHYLHKNHDQDPDTGEYLTDDSVTEQLRAASALVADPDKYLLSDAFNDYIQEVSKHIRAQTVTGKSRRIQAFLSYLKADKEPAQVSKQEAGKYLTDVLNRSELSIKTIKDTLSDLSAFFNWLEKRGYVQNNPFRNLSGSVKETTRGTRSKVKRREWSTEELKRLLTALGTLKANDPLIPYTLIALYSGMRSNEIASIELGDVHDGHVFIPEGKTESSVRDVPLHPVLTPLVNSLKQTSVDGFLISGLRPGGEDSKRNHYIIKRFVRFNRVTVGVNDSAVVFHSLRKNFASQLERSGVPENIAQQIIGHAKQSLTYGLYSHGVKMETLRDAVERVSYGPEVDRLARELGSSFR